MKTILLMLLTLVMFASCTKEQEITPIQKVTYSVECKNCLIYVDDNIREGQHFVVAGKWNYTFENTKLDSVNMRIYTSIFYSAQNVKASIKADGKSSVSVDKLFGMDNDFTRPVLTDTVLTLKLK